MSAERKYIDTKEFQEWKVKKKRGLEKKKLSEVIGLFGGRSC